MGNADWENQRAFLAVMREGSLSAAARVLGLAQPTVRRRLEALERFTGVALFARSPSGLSPTQAAHELAVHVEAMAAAAEAFARASSAEAGAVAGTVRITASEVIGAEVLPPILASLREDFPGLVFELNLSNRNEDLLRREADIAVRMVRPTQEAILVKRVGVVTLGFFAHAAYLQRHGVPTSMAELGRSALIGPDRDTRSLSILRDAGLEPRREMLTIRTDSQLAQLNAIRAGLGIGVCQKGLARRTPELVAVLPEVFAYDLETWIAMHEDLRRVRRVRVVFDHLAAALSEYVRQQ